MEFGFKDLAMILVVQSSGAVALESTKLTLGNPVTVVTTGDGDNCVMEEGVKSYEFIQSEQVIMYIKPH